MVSTEKKAAPASTVECFEQGEACTGRLGHPLYPYPSPANTTLALPLNFDGCGRESEVGGAQPFFT